MTVVHSEFYKKIVVHLAIALTVILIPSLLIYLADQSGFTEAQARPFLYLFSQAATGIFIFFLPLVYFAVYWLIPTYLIKKRYPLFILGVLLTIFVWGYFISYFEPWTDEHWFGQPLTEPNPLIGIIATTFLLLITTLINLSYRWFVQLSQIKQMENDQLKKELSMLKNQINPHFFFNTLNNLYALSLTHSDDTPKIIMKLSELMRYTIYECKKPFVSIENEVKYIENYIDLQQIRLHEHNQIIFNKSIETSNVKVAPMLLIVLLENAFKHGVESMSEGAVVQVNLNVNEKSISFNVENNYKPVPIASQVVGGGGGGGGVGLENVKKRLTLLYGDAHTFRTNQSKDMYSASLEIQLS